MIAAELGHIEILKLLIEAKADTMVKTSNSGTALMLASAEGKIEAMKLLINANPDVINATDKWGWVCCFEERKHTHIHTHTYKQKIIQKLF